MARYWTCRRQSKGKKCEGINSARRQFCARCGKRKPPRRKPPAHMAILEMPYEEWVVIYGEHCGICGRKRSEVRKLDRDHDHVTGKARGLLCHRCNRHLPLWITVAWLESAAKYLGEQDAEEKRT